MGRAEQRVGRRLLLVGVRLCVFGGWRARGGEAVARRVVVVTTVLITMVLVAFVNVLSHCHGYGDSRMLMMCNGANKSGGSTGLCRNNTTFM